MVVVHDLGNLGFPLISKVLDATGLLVPIKIRVLRIENVPRPPHLVGDFAVFHAARGVTERAAVMERGQQFHVVVLANGRGNLAVDIPFRPHVLGVPAIHLAVPEQEPIVMNQTDAAEFRAGLVHQADPFVRVELRCREERDEILVTEFVKRPVFLRVVRVDALFVRPRSLVQIPDIVRPAMCRHRVDAPMRVDTELGVLQPLRDFMARQGIPIGLILCLIGPSDSRKTLTQGNGDDDLQSFHVQFVLCSDSRCRVAAFGSFTCGIR